MASKDHYECIEMSTGSELVLRPLARNIKLRVAHAPGMPGTFPLPPWLGDPVMHQCTYVTHGPWCMQQSLTSGFLWSRWREKRSRYSRRMHNPQFYVSGRRPMTRGMMWLIYNGFFRWYFFISVMSVYRNDVCVTSMQENDWKHESIAMFCLTNQLEWYPLWL